MKSNVVYYILLLLDTENSVRVPGLGVLTRHVHSAKILTKEWLVKPPHATVDFKATGKEKGKLLARYISYKSGVDHHVAEDHVGTFAKAVRSSLQKSGKASVDHLGVFYQKEENIYFAADVKTANAAYHGLKTVGLPGMDVVDEKMFEQEEVIVIESVVAPIIETQDVSPEPLVDVTQEQPEEQIAAVQVLDLSTDTQISETEVAKPEKSPDPAEDSAKKRTRVPLVLPIFLAIFLGVTALAIMQYNKRDALYHPAATYNRAPVQDSPIFGSGNENNSATDDEASTIVPETTGKDDVDSDPTINDVLDKNARAILGLENENETSDEVVQDEETESAELSIASEKLNAPVEHESQLDITAETEGAVDKTGDTRDSSEESKVSKESFPEEKSTVLNDVAASDAKERRLNEEAVPAESLTSDCYVIVGAFGVQSNVDRMIARLAKMGYETASMSRSNLTQIGVPAPCGSSDIQSILDDLQLNVEAEAWIYKK